jgi:hypothetical protein
MNTNVQAPGPDPGMQPIGYAGPERWRKTPIPCWGLRGTAPEDYEVVSDRNEHTAGKASVAISSVRQTSGWGTLYQFANAEGFRGKRIVFTADLRTFGVATEASLLVRVDDANGRAVALDNMWYSYGADRSQGAFSNRSLSGDNDWSSTSVVLDVPPEAHAISYGVALTGSGKVWIDNAHLEVVADDTPTTAMQRTPNMLEPMATFRMAAVPSAPKNLDFEPGEGCE